MIGGNKPRNPFHDDWSVSHVAPVFEPSDFTNAYHLVNQALYGDGSEFLGGSGYGAYFKAGVEHYKGASPGNIWSVGSLANNYIHNPSTFNRRELLDAGVRDFNYGTWWTSSGMGGYRLSLTYDFGTLNYGNDNYYYGYQGFFDITIGAMNLSKRNSSSFLRVSGGMLNIGGLYAAIESKLHFNETLGFWQGKNGKFYSLSVNGNGSTGGKLKYGRMMGESFRRASGLFNAAGLLLSARQCYLAESIDDKIKYGADLFFGGLGFAPGGTVISAFWFFGGRELVFQYGNMIGDLLKDGVNPGYPVYQPFK